MTSQKAPRAENPADNLPEFTVSEISGSIKKTLEDAFGRVRVRGEISGFKRHSSGHCYLTLKDDKAALAGVMFRNNTGKLRFAPEDGLEVVCTGRVSAYPVRSTYQIIIDTMEPAGAGALMALLEERKKKLAAEGLFAEERKKPIPFLPRVIGVVTSPTGAVIRDIMHRLNDRFPRHVVLWPVAVQGEGAAEQVAGAVAGFNRLPPGGKVPRPDVLIVARGGGSIEDLWAFNEEAVVRAVAASDIPVISAVGHETDTTLIDFAADRRAPTPTAAAEAAVPVRSELMTATMDLERRLVGGMARFLDSRRQSLAGLVRGLPRLRDILGLPQQRYDELAERLPRALTANTAFHERRFLTVAAGLKPRLLRDRIGREERYLGELQGRLGRALTANTAGHERRLTAVTAGLKPRLLRDRIAQDKRRLAELDGRLVRGGRSVVQTAQYRFDGVARLFDSLNYKRVLDRGFAVVRDANGKAVVSAAAPKAGEGLEIEFKDGTTPVIVGDTGRKKAKRRQTAASDQGRLF